MTGVHAGWVLSRERIRIRGVDPVGQWGRQHGRARPGECPIRPCEVVDPMHVWKLHARKPGDLPFGRPRDGAVRMGKAAKAEAHDARTGEVRLLHSTWEADEQGRETGGGVGGGKGGGQGERGPAKHAPDTGPGKRVTGAGPCTRGRKAMAKRALLRQTPEAGARCVSSARRDLCGGRGVTRVPTAIGIPDLN